MSASDDAIVQNADQNAIRLSTTEAVAESTITSHDGTVEQSAAPVKTATDAVQLQLCANCNPESSLSTIISPSYKKQLDSLHTKERVALHKHSHAVQVS